MLYITMLAVIVELLRLVHIFPVLVVMELLDISDTLVVVAEPDLVVM